MQVSLQSLLPSTPKGPALDGRRIRKALSGILERVQHFLLCSCSCQSLREGTLGVWLSSTCCQQPCTVCPLAAHPPPQAQMMGQAQKSSPCPLVSAATQNSGIMSGSYPFTVTLWSCPSHRAIHSWKVLPPWLAVCDFLHPHLVGACVCYALAGSSGIQGKNILCMPLASLKFCTLCRVMHACWQERHAREAMSLPCCMAGPRAKQPTLAAFLVHTTLHNKYQS